VTLTLESEAKDELRTVYSKELKSYDPEIVPVSGEIPLVKLARGQRLRLEAYARLGRGQDHAKWQPVASCTHKYAPIIHIDLEKCNLCNNCVEACLNQVLVMNDTLKVIDVESCNLCRECMRVCPQDAIRVEKRTDTFIINIESTGVLPPERIFLESNKILQDKTGAFTTLMTQIKKGETG
jgi:DNA-directed RNA polymerase subunit D